MTLEYDDDSQSENVVGFDTYGDDPADPPC